MGKKGGEAMRYTYKDEMGEEKVTWGTFTGWLFRDRRKFAIFTHGRGSRTLIPAKTLTAETRAAIKEGRIE